MTVVKMAKNEKKQLNHPVPIELFNWLKEESVKERRSMSNFIVSVLYGEKERREKKVCE